MHPAKTTPLGRKVRPMTPEDLDEVLAIENASFPKPWTREMFERELSNPISFSYVIREREGERERLAGYTVFWIIHGESHILNIAVHPELRRRFVAEELLTAALEVMIDRLAFEVFLEVRVSNTAAQRLYRKFGFREAFVRKNYYGDEDAIVMTLFLGEEGGF